MSLPFLFSAVTTLVTSQIDANNNALGALSVLACTVSGTNTITLTQQANSPNPVAYRNYLVFSGIAAGTNTTAVTAQLAALGGIPVYKDSSAGPIALSGGEIVINCAFFLMYDGALNAGSGGFHLLTGLASTSVLTNSVSATASIGWPNIPASTGSISTIPVTGCSVGDCVILGLTASVPTGVIFNGWVNNAGTVTIQALNVTAASITPIAGTYRATAQRFAP